MKWEAKRLLFWLSYVVLLSSAWHDQHSSKHWTGNNKAQPKKVKYFVWQKRLPRKFADCVFVLINKRSFEPFICLDVRLIDWEKGLSEVRETNCTWDVHCTEWDELRDVQWSQSGRVKWEMQGWPHTARWHRADHTRHDDTRLTTHFTMTRGWPYTARWHGADRTRHDDTGLTAQYTMTQGWPHNTRWHRADHTFHDDMGLTTHGTMIQGWLHTTRGWPHANLLCF